MLTAAPAAACVVAPEASAIPGSLAEVDANTGIVRGWYQDPTDIYGHGIMGSVPDALRLVVVSDAATNSCGTMIAEAGAGHVFEDITPRLADVDGDGRAEVIAVRSSLTQGAQLVVYAEGANDTLSVLAATPYIGRRNRWLAPAAVADLDGDGAVDIAFVDRPHLAKTLRIWRYADGALTEVAAAAGVTNHRIGDEVIYGGLRTCDGTPEILLASANWSDLLALAFEGDRITARDLGAYSETALSAEMTCRTP